ncbi:MAG: hypothetical protein DMF90_04065 [Acidobacteria bacterium]|nr:MAG: hypothetical protein DMF90_04065 [Acidobacteriota bacterium]
MLKALVGYVTMLLGAIALFLVVRSAGEALTAPVPTLLAPESAATAGGTASTDVVFHVLLALAAVVLVGRLLGAVLRAFGQPPVIGEVLGGILLGPSLLGRVAPEVSTYVLPASVAPALSVVAQLGVVLYMFLVGLELNGDLLRRRAQATVAISHASLSLPAAGHEHRDVHDLRPVHGRRDVDHRLPGPGPHPVGSRDDQDRTGGVRAHVRRHRRCHRLVLAGVRRRRGQIRRAKRAVDSRSDGRVHRHDVSGFETASHETSRPIGRPRRADAGGARAGPGRSAAVGARDRARRHPCHLRRVPIWRDHSA